jgi:hypothetical protein
LLEKGLKKFPTDQKATNGQKHKVATSLMRKILSGFALSFCIKIYTRFHPAPFPYLKRSGTGGQAETKALPRFRIFCMKAGRSEQP